jgi:hypothetical protein
MLVSFCTRKYENLNIEVGEEILPFGFVKAAYFHFFFFFVEEVWGKTNDQGIAFNSSLCLKYFLANSSPPTAESSIQ